MGTAASFIKRLYSEIDRDQVSNAAGALAFYTMLALLPAAIFGLSLLPYLGIPHLQQAITDLLYQLMPRAAADLFTQTVQRMLSQRNTRLLSFSLAFAIWSGSSGLRALMQQLNVVHGVSERRPFWKTRAIAAGLMLLWFGLLVVTLGVVIFGGVVQHWAASVIGWSPALRLLFSTVRWLLIGFALLTGFAVIYRLAPDVDRPFRWFAAGNFFAALGLVLASFGFKIYVSNFGQYELTYGGLGAAISLLLWLFIGGLVILIGAEINDLIETGAYKRAETPAQGDHAPVRVPPETRKAN
jgi:membrane protein